jgi:pimeloyl-ACP methyl ester carboxylesterase
MLFCHGFPECWYSWRHLLKTFSRDFDAVAIDMRGYGQTEKPHVGPLFGARFAPIAKSVG